MEKKKNGEMNFLKKIAGIDLRTLALYRVCLGLAVISVYLSLWWDLPGLFSNEGILPQPMFLRYPVLPIGSLSIFLIDKEAGMIYALFILGMLFAVALAVGWKTRPMAFLTWFFLSSLHARNPYVWHAGDQILRYLAFWAMFLPLGERYAWDSPVNPKKNREQGIAVLALRANTLLVCMFGMSVLGDGRFPFAIALLAVPFLPSFVWDGLKDIGAVRGAGARILRILTRPRLLDPPAVHRPLEPLVRQSTEALALIFMLFAFYLVSSGYDGRPKFLHALNDATLSHRAWEQLDSKKNSGALTIAAGLTKEGSEIDLISGKKTEGHSAERYRHLGPRWNILIRTLAKEHSKSLDNLFLRYWLERWNRKHTGNLKVTRGYLYRIDPATGSWTKMIDIEVRDPGKNRGTPPGGSSRPKFAG